MIERFKRKISNKNNNIIFKLKHIAGLLFVCLFIQRRLQTPKAASRRRVICHHWRKIGRDETFSSKCTAVWHRTSERLLTERSWSVGALLAFKFPLLSSTEIECNLASRNSSKFIHSGSTAKSLRRACQLRKLLKIISICVNLKLKKLKSSFTCSSRSFKKHLAPERIFHSLCSPPACAGN